MKYINTTWNILSNLQYPRAIKFRRVQLETPIPKVTQSTGWLNYTIIQFLDNRMGDMLFAVCKVVAERAYQGRTISATSKQQNHY